MPICISCSTPVKNLYTTYSKADDRSLGKGVRLTQCPNCKRFADKYVEHDFVVLFIDLVLIKPQVYRHLLFNRLGRADDKLDPSIVRLGILLILFDVYITWARIEKSNVAGAARGQSGANVDVWLSEAPILTQYLFFLTMNVLATITQHTVIRLLARVLVASRNREDGTSVIQEAPLRDTASVRPSPHLHSDDKETTVGYTVGPGHASPSAISTALLVSSCTKLFPILLVIWPTEGIDQDAFGFAFRASNYVGWAVLLNNIEALLILLDCGYVVATALAVAGVVSRWFVEGWVLSLVGLGWDAGPVRDLMAALGRVRKWFPVG